MQIDYSANVSNNICLDCQNRIKLAYKIRGELIKALSRENKPKIQVYQIITKTNDSDGGEKSLGDGSVLHEELVEITEVDEDFNVIGTGSGDTDAGGDGDGEDDQIFVQEFKKPQAKSDEVEIDYLNENEGELIIDDDQEDAVSFLLDKKELFRKSDESKGSGQRRHNCTACEKTFMRKSNLIDHLRLHANIRPFKCEHCNKEFVQAGNYRSHLRVSTNGVLTKNKSI